MKPQRVLQLPSVTIDADTPVHWSVFDAEARLQASGRCALGAVREASAPHFRSGETRVLVPGELVLLTQVRIPTRQVRHIKQALPYMVEEMIAENIEDVHLALPGGKLDWDGDVPVAVVSHRRLIDWLDQLYHQGISPDFLGPDTLAAPWREHTRSFFAAPGADGGTRLICRDDAYRGLVITPEQLPALLATGMQATEALVAGVPTRDTVSAGSDGGDALTAVSDALQAAGVHDIEVAPFAEPAAEVLATTAVRDSEQMINLLQGGYRLQRSGGDAHLWRRVASVAGIGLLAYVLVAAGGGMYFSWRAGQVEARTFALYHQLFPHERRVVSPRRQMASHLQGGGVATGNSVLPLLARTADSLAGGGATAKVESLHASQQRRELQLQLSAPSLDALEQVKQRLEAGGLTAELGASSQQGGSTVAQLQVRARRS